MVMKIWISQNVFEFGPSAKTFNEKHLKGQSILGNKSAIFNRPSDFLPPYLATLIQSQNTISSTSMNYNYNNL